MSAEPLAVPTVYALDLLLTRDNMAWSDIASKWPGTRATRPIRRRVDERRQDRRARDIADASLLFTIVDAPRWANGGASPQHAPTRPADFGTFCGVVARRYPTVARYTIWNEPNRGQFLQPQGAGGKEAPGALAGLARACIPAIHAASPKASVAIGPVASRGAQGGPRRSRSSPTTAPPQVRSPMPSR